MAGRHGERGQLGLAELDLDVCALGDEQCVVARLRVVDEQPAHLRRGLQVELVGVELEPVGVVERGAGLDAQQRGVGFGVLLVRVVRVVRREQWRVQLVRHLHELRVDVALLGQAVVLELDEEGAASEYVLEARRVVACGGVVPRHELLAHQTAEAPARRDQTRTVLLQELEVDARLVIEAVEVRVRGDLDQVPVPVVRLGEQRQVVDVVLGALRPVEPAGADEICLAPDDGSQVRFARRSVEVEDAVHVAVVGDADRGLAVGFGGGNDVGDPGGAVQHRELGVQMQVHERAPQGAATPSSRPGRSRPRPTGVWMTLWRITLV